MSEPDEVAMTWKRQLAFAGRSVDFDEIVNVMRKSSDVEEERLASWFAGFSPTWYGPTPVALAERWRAVVEMMEVLPRTPANLEDRLLRLESSVTRLSEALLSRPVVSSTRIVDLNSVDYFVQQPIPVVIEEYTEESVATFPEIEAHGFGVSPAEAINDLKEQIVLLYEDLDRADPQVLGKLPTAWWRILQQYVAQAEEI